MGSCGATDRFGMAGAWSVASWLEAMFPLALAAHCDRYVRREGDARSKFLTLPGDPWFTALLDRSEIKLHARSRTGAGQGRSRVSAFVAVRPRQTYAGALTPFDREERLLWAYFRKPLDAFSLRIDKVLALGATEEIVLPARYECRIGSRTSVQFGCGRPVFHSFPPLRSGGGCTLLTHVTGFDAFCATAQVPNGCNIPVVLLPRAILTLIKRGRWSHLLFSASWRNVRELLSWPAPEWFLAMEPQAGMRFPDRDAADVPAGRLREMSLRTKRWAPVLLNAIEAEAGDSSVVRFHLEQLVGYLDMTADVAEGVEGLPGQRSRFKVSSDRLIHMVRLCTLLRNRSKLSSAVSCAIQSVKAKTSAKQMATIADDRALIQSMFS